MEPGLRKLEIDNRSGYATSDLRDFFQTAMRNLGLHEKKSILVVSSPIRSRGCAEVGPMKRGRKEGEKVVIALASPSHFSLKRLTNLTIHELGHTAGLEHEDMPYNMHWSIGPLPSWARRFDRPNWPRYTGRAPPQLGNF